MVEQRTIDAVMVPAPRQATGGHAGDRLVWRAGAAGELQRVAPHEAGRAVGLVELLAPHHRLRPAVAVHLLGRIAELQLFAAGIARSRRAGSGGSKKLLSARQVPASGASLSLSAALPIARRTPPIRWGTEGSNPAS